MESITYGFGRDLSLPFADAVTQVTAALAAEGFGILTRIDVHEVLKKRLDLDLPPYVILGACNPHLASQAIAGEPQIGLLLPCNVLVKANPQGGTTVSFADPAVMGSLTANDAMAPHMEAAKAKLTRALEAL